MALTYLPFNAPSVVGNPEAKQWVQETVKVSTVDELREKLAAAGRACWEDLFRNVITEADLETWEKSIPSYGCDCANFYKSWKRENPPTYPLPFSWKYNLKSAVNAKLGKPNISFEEAFDLYYPTTQ